MKILEELRKMPWKPEQARVDDLHDGVAYTLPVSKLGLRLLMTCMSVFLLLFVIAYSDRMVVSDWRPLQDPWVLWFNTALLIFSSLAMQKSLVSVRQDQRERMKNYLYLAGGFSFAFVLGQFWVWNILIESGYFAAANPANAFFYLLTGLHGAHLLGGLVAWGRLMVKDGNRVETKKMAESVELCTIYWHFLLVVWIVFFGLLLFS